MDFYVEQRRTHDGEVRAAAFAAEYATWRREHHRYPIHFPEVARKAVPLSTSDVTRRMHSARERQGYGFMRDCIEHELGRCQHPEHAAFCQLHGHHHEGHEHKVRARRKPGVDFGEDTWITTGSEHSEFDDVDKGKAETVISLAEPQNWSKAAPAFFKDSSSGTWNPYAERFEADERLASKTAFQLCESVEWNYTPETVGGALNILTISDVKRSPEKAGDLRLFYRYDLHRCIQTRFLTNWEYGGIDVDEGYYDAHWSASSHKLTIKAIKRVRYSRNEEHVQGLSTTLNLLSPALIGMLMGQLAFHGVRDFLEGKKV